MPRKTAKLHQENGSQYRDVRMTWYGYSIETIVFIVFRQCMIYFELNVRNFGQAMAVLELYCFRRPCNMATIINTEISSKLGLHLH